MIRDPHVETVNGQRVNVLSPGDRYIYKYEVLFTSPLRNVSCWMALVDQQGETIVSNGLNGRGYFELIAEGSLLKVRRVRLPLDFGRLLPECRRPDFGSRDARLTRVGLWPQRSLSFSRAAKSLLLAWSILEEPDGTSIRKPGHPLFGPDR